MVFGDMVTVYKWIHYLMVNIQHSGDTHTLCYRNITEIPGDYITYCFAKSNYWISYKIAVS